MLRAASENELGRKGMKYRMKSLVRIFSYPNPQIMIFIEICSALSESTLHPNNGNIVLIVGTFELSKHPCLDKWLPATVNGPKYSFQKSLNPC